MQRSFPLLALLILVVAAASLTLRLPRLGQRPMHPDEANQAAKAANLAGLLPEAGVFRYDPREHHGPTLYWLTLPSLGLSGAEDFADTQEWVYRIVPVIFGAGLVLLVLLVADGLSPGPAIAAALLTAISPAMVYYARDYIQETLLVFFTLATIGCGWRYFRRPSIGWAIGAGVSLGLMHATKETWVLAGAAMTAGVLLAGVWTRWRDGTPWSYRHYSRPVFLLAGLAAACVAAAALFSSFGRDWQGPVDSVRAYGIYWRRGSESGIHTAPWYEYLRLLLTFRPARGFFWTEGLIVGLAVVGGAYSLCLRGNTGTRRDAGASPGVATPGLWGAARRFGDDPCPAFCRFLTFYTLILTALYCAVPYKTPWCLVSFLDGMILLAGVGVHAVLRWARIRPPSPPAPLPKRARGVASEPLKVLAGGILLAGAAHLGWETYWLSFRLGADPRNPYVYAHTSADVLNLAARMERLAQSGPEGYDMQIHVVMPENYWPLPWYLRRFNRGHVGYWQDAAAWARDAASCPPPSAIVLSPDVQEAVDAHLRAAYNKQMLFGLRPGVFVSVYVRDDLWQAATMPGP